MTERDAAAPPGCQPTLGWAPPPADWAPPAPMVVEPVRLDGRIVRLEPLEDRHIPGLMAAGSNQELWRWTVEWLDTPEKLRAYLAFAERSRDDGTQLPFVTVAQERGEVIGSTRFLNIDRANHRLEIGYTWVVPGRQRGGVNLEAKLLQLTHAFETLGCRRVEFKTDSLNDKSRNALLGHRRHVRGHLPQPHDQPGRPHAALGLLQRDRRGVAGGQARPGSATGAPPRP